MLNFTPALSRIRAKFATSPLLLEQAAEVIELEPGSIAEVPPAISLSGELDRVKSFYGGAGSQLPRLLESMREEGPTLGYRLDDAVLADFTLYASGTHLVYRSGSKRAVIVGKPSEIEEAQLCTTACVETYFGHFLRDALPLELLAHERELLPLSFRRQPWLHEPAYRELLGMRPVRTRYARVQKLWLVDETALNEGWAGRFSELRRRIRERIKPTGDSHVFLRRGSMAAARNLVNERQLTEELERRGFRVIEPENMDAPSICAALAGARIVACVEGSVQNHALMAMPAGAALLSIQPPERFNSLPKLIADGAGVRFAYVVAESRNNGFYLDPARFMQTLELLS
jgi:capsular polysaccharide biosynthesis protein